MVLRDPPPPKKKNKKGEEEEDDDEEGQVAASAAKASASAKRKDNKKRRTRTSTGPTGTAPKKTPASTRVNKSTVEETARGALRAVNVAKSKAAAKSMKDLSKDELLALYDTGTIDQKKMALAILMERVPESGATSEEAPARKSADGAGTSTGTFTKPTPTNESRRARRDAATKKVDEMQDGTGECLSFAAVKLLPFS